MPKKTITVLAILVPLFLLVFGDFMPQPIRGFSAQLKNTANEAVLGVFPSWRPKTKPYERTERALDGETNASPSPSP